MTAEQERLDAGAAWKQWGPYLAERAWGTVREDYTADGEAWDGFPHDHARSRAYRWNEDGLGGVCDDTQTWCLAFALWNGVDPILKERAFGLSGPEGNHGEDAKDCWWYLDSTPTHSWMRWRYHYPQRAFPYDELVLVNRERGRDRAEHELVDTGAFDGDRYWVVDVDYAKAGEHDLCVRVRVTNRGPDTAELHLLPTLWFRNTWSWQEPPGVPPTVRGRDGALLAEHPVSGRLVLASDGDPGVLLCDNETNTGRLHGVPPRTSRPKDGIADHVVHGAPTAGPDGEGSKGALHHRLVVASGETREVRLRLSAGGRRPGLGRTWERALQDRAAEADAFYAALPGMPTDPVLADVARQALAGMLWSKQYYAFDVRRWLDGDPSGPPVDEGRRRGRNAGWQHLANADVISMPDTWEYPWYAAWDLAFHAVALAHVDAGFAKEQLLLLCREWYMHPNGQLPAYEWAFDDVNPPVHAWAGLRVFEIDGATDHHFLERLFHKLLLNFTWWVNRKDADGNNVFEGGFLGMDNVGPVDRSKPLPADGRLAQSDGTAWMAMYCLNMLEMALVLAEHDEAYEDMATKFFEHFAYIASAMEDQGLWDEQDGAYYDLLVTGDGRRIPFRVRSMVGLLPLCATTTLGEATLQRLPRFAARVQQFLESRPEHARVVGAVHVRDGAAGQLLSVVPPERLPRLLASLSDEADFLSPHGLRSLSVRHRDDPFVLDVDGWTAQVGYEPAESASGLFGGNSNWRGPVWFPVNLLLVQAVRRFARYYGDDLLHEHPTGSGRLLPLRDVADDLCARLVGLFVPDAAGGRPSDAGRPFSADPRWAEGIWFYEYFDGDTGAGLGASHQTGWTGLVADVLLRHGRSPDED